MKSFKNLLVIAVLAMTAFSTSAQAPSWNQTLERIATGVVSIRVDSTRAFDTERNRSTQATGFVVDAARGLILTNRHVVTPGPVRAQAIFLNQEEVDLIPVYRDPIHDFGFFRYDPSDLVFMQPAEIALVPEAAQVGSDIRVVGNDAGEQLSILAGTIARLDRQAPNYGRGNYNDFNTFYLQAASGTSGGSSGSPVIDIDGRAIALNAGANTQAASSFFLPLDRVQSALQLIQQDLPVPRGTLQTEFVRKPFAELRRLGLTEESEAAARSAHPGQTGMLVVEQVIPGSPAAELLEPGDVLVYINGELVTEFVPLAAVLDDSVGRTVELIVERGGESVARSLPVHDLHALTPDEYIEYGDGVFHNLSYQQARHYFRPIEGVYVASPGYVFGTAGIPRASLITEIQGTSVANLDEFQRVMESLPEGQQVSVRFVPFDDPRSEHQRILTNSRTWYPAVRCHRDDASGVWPCQELAAGPPSPTREPRATTFPDNGDEHLNTIHQSLVLVNFDMPYTVSGVSDRYYYGTGVIADAERGWVIVDRNTVPVAIGDVRLTFAGSLEIPGQVEYVHPLHNLAVVSYDTALIGDTPARSANFVAEDVVPGQSVLVVGLSPDHSLRSQSAEVGSLTDANFPPSRTFRFRDSNLEAISLVSGPGGFDGVITDRAGGVLALWSSFAFQSGRDLNQVNLGVSAELVVDMLEHMRSDTLIRSLEVEWRSMPLATASKLDLPEHWAHTYETHNRQRRQVLSVSSVVAGTPAVEFFRAGDILLAINGEPANTFREVERASQQPYVEVTIFRDGREITETVNTVELGGVDIDRVLVWAGALIQAPHRELSAQRSVEPIGVYVSFYNFGSPANRAGLVAGRRIVAVNGQPTLDMDGFVAAVQGLNGEDAVRLHTVTWNDVPEVITLRLDELYWPGYELRREGGRWYRQRLQQAPQVVADTRP
jgi:pro-apoptotic serine protease NMA111